MAGWIKLHRDLRNWRFYKKDGYFILWCHLLLEAHHGDTSIYDGIGNEIKKGQFSTGILRLAQETGLSRGKVERILKNLEIENQIERQRTNKCSIITIVEWEKYQNREAEREASVKQVRSKREASVNRTRMQECKNGENGKKYIHENEVVFRWNSFGDLPRFKGTDKQMKEISTRIKSLKKKFDYGVGDVLEAIDNYRWAYSSKESFYSHKWTLELFLTRGNNRSFYPDQFSRENYYSHKSDKARINRLMDMENPYAEE